MKIAKIAAKNIISRSKISSVSYAINPYVGCPHGCIYCYAEFMREVSGHKEAWGEFLDVKDFDTAQLAKFATKHGGEHVFMSSVTDSYNPFEAQFKNTRKVLETLAGSDVNLQILTKSDFILRDIDLFKTMPNLRAGFSICLLDENLRRMFEPRACAISRRLDALKILHENGVKTFVFVAPIFPEITPIFEIVSHCTVADEICFDRLNLYPNFRDKILAFIGRNFPNLLPLYKQIYLFGDVSYFTNLASEIRSFMDEKNIKYKVFWG